MPISFPSGPRITKRKPLPTFRSTSQTTRDQPRGPNQRLSNSGLENASKTRWRGASKTRVRTTSRSLGIVTFNVPVFFIAFSSIVYRFLYRFGDPRFFFRVFNLAGFDGLIPDS